MPNFHPTPYAQRRRSEQYTRANVTLISCSVSVESWEGLAALAENYREDKHKLPITRFINRYITQFRILNVPQFMLDARDQQGGVWTHDDFAASEQRQPRKLRLTRAATIHLEALPYGLGIPVRFSIEGGAAIGLSLELIGRGWIIR